MHSHRIFLWFFCWMVRLVYHKDILSTLYGLYSYTYLLTAFSPELSLLFVNRWGLCIIKVFDLSLHAHRNSLFFGSKLRPMYHKSIWSFCTWYFHCILTDLCVFWLKGQTYVPLRYLIFYLVHFIPSCNFLVGWWGLSIIYIFYPFYTRVFWLNQAYWS